MFGEGTQRAYAYHLVDHRRWLGANGYSEDTITVEDLKRYMALCGTQHPGPLGVPWRDGPLSDNTLVVRAACLKGYYLDVTGCEGINSALRAALSATRLTTGRDRDRSFLGHLARSLPANPLSRGVPPRRHHGCCRTARSK